MLLCYEQAGSSTQPQCNGNMPHGLGESIAMAGLAPSFILPPDPWEAQQLAAQVEHDAQGSMAGLHNNVLMTAVLQNRNALVASMHRLAGSLTGAAGGAHSGVFPERTGGAGMMPGLNPLLMTPQTMLASYSTMGSPAVHHPLLGLPTAAPLKPPPTQDQHQLHGAGSNPFDELALERVLSQDRSSLADIFGPGGGQAGGSQQQEQEQQEQQQEQEQQQVLRTWLWPRAAACA